MPLPVDIGEPAAGVRSHGGPKVVAGKRGQDLGGGQMVEIGMDFACEFFSEVSGNNDARGEVGVAV